ncbi:MAG: substrate-binding domain-containing protein [Alphaproteobacteria bacterium]
MKLKALIFGAATLGVMASPAVARDHIQIVGSSTVFPFATAVAEQFGKTTQFKTPVIEATGSGGGMKLFCSGIGLQNPDITNASRRIKAKEVELCAKNGVTDITEVKVGFDGIVLANARTADRYTLTKKQVFLALAKQVPMGESEALIDNPYTHWNQIDPSLPAAKIEVMGPPPTSGTRDAFVELAMEGGAKTFATLKALRGENKKAFKAIAHAVREDGVYEEAGENDNLIVKKLSDRPTALGIFGFSFLDQNADVIQGSIVDGAEPTFDNIAAGDYGVSRSLYFYVKHAHVNQVPGIKEFIAEFTSEAASGEDGYLADKGLIPLPDDERAVMAEQANGLAKFDASVLNK